MQVVRMTFNTLPFIDDFPGQGKVTIERHAFHPDQTEDLVKAANTLGASEILIETGTGKSDKPSAPPEDSSQ